MSYAMHVRLAQRYTADPRFKEHFEIRAPGVASFVEAAIKANAERAGAGPGTSEFGCC